MTPTEKRDLYAECLEKLDALLAEIEDPIAIMATLNGVLKQVIPYYFWVGFYLVRDDHLLVGPYQGTVGCLRIAPGRGVCGAAAASRKTVIVPDTAAFPGHIACDPNSKSEIVVPVIDAQGELVGVWDVDSAQRDAFDETDQAYLEEMIRVFLVPHVLAS